ncbi:FAD-dependent oxidoreductase [Rhodovarius crocodyli]|uniref:FAD-dependent oxidoreductase n=1 Tax=Rhodovarius crocodyli TaxID=1979269 RepID=A0A437MLT5_9PROT|nr:2Fe-2S iron-sulfur cluster-binding protein [Rhodovarius crocodyli]RVT98601.1 FAD-dependent oxidoreductase [Rhodovarius crocodyli]
MIRRIPFRFDGREYRGHERDTLSSALLANGVRIVGRSFKYHRPRGIFGYGADEPNALFQLGDEPNCRGGLTPLTAGLDARGQNAWPSVGFDLGAVAGLAAPLLPAGFYYKTFMAPRRLWPLYEGLIRRAAGLGRAPRAPDPHRYDTRHAHVEVLVVGGGPAGIAAAMAAAAPGRRVMLVDDGARLGLMAGDPDARIGGQPAADWLAAREAELAAMPDVTLLRRATAYAVSDSGRVDVIQHLDGGGARQCRWVLHAGRIILATGAQERPLVFADNDRPGVMLASAARAYATRHAALPGRRAVIFTGDDGAYGTALALQAAGVEIEAVVDPRPHAGPLAEAARTAGIRCLPGQVVVKALGARGVKGCLARPIEGGAMRRLNADTLLVSGGFTPNLQLFTQAGGRTGFDEGSGAFLPVAGSTAVECVGGCAGAVSLAEALAHSLPPDAMPAVEEAIPAPPSTLSVMPKPRGLRGKRFIDLHNDVTVEDLNLAVREGFGHIEQVKRYTTLGMGTDQGRTSGLIGAGHAAGQMGRALADVGVTRPRPPVSPVTFGALAGGHVGPNMAPSRVTPIQPWHDANGARMAQVGSWRRPQLYPRAHETDQQAIDREVLNTRTAVGIVDVSTLGKFDLRGRDVPELLNRVYVNAWSNLPVGRCRYGVMLREDGMVLDDGTTSRLGENHYVMTVTTGNAERVQAHLDRLLQLAWPELDVRLTPVTEQWAAIGIAGPRAREVLAALAEFDVSDAALPYMALAQGQVVGIPARVFRISFSGERAYEVNVPAQHGQALWEAAMAAGAQHGIMPYGTEAMLTMRAEKGFFMPGFEADGRTTLDDLGLGRMMSRKKGCVGQAALRRPAFAAPDRKQMVGLLTLDAAQPMPRGAQIVADGPSIGHITAGLYSATLERWIALALVEGGRARMGETLTATAPMAGQSVPVRVVDPVFLDPEGERLRG